MIRCGKILEIFTYEKGFYYSRDPFPVKEHQKHEEQRKDHLMRAQGMIRRLVNANSNAFGCKPIFITYTFADNIVDLKEANLLYTAHMRVLKRIVGKSLKYVVVPEFQEKRAKKDGKGAWHYHTIFFDLPYVKGIKKILSEAWPHGFFKVKTIRHVKNIGAYVSKYFSKQWANRRPLHTKSYFTSFGLIQPQTSYQQSDFQEITESCKLTEEMSRSYDTAKFGRINYKQFRII